MLVLLVNWGVMSGVGFVEDNVVFVFYFESIGMFGVEMEDVFVGLFYFFC